MATARTDAAPALGMLAIAAAALLWATAAVVASALFRRGVGPPELTLARVAIAAVGLGAIGGARRPAEGLPAPRLVAFGVSIALVTATYYWAIERLAVAVAIVIQYLAPVLVVVWMAASSRRAPSREVVVALVGAVTGVALISEVFTEPLGDVNAAGIAFALASALFFAVYTVLGESAGIIYGPTGAMFRAFAIATALWVVLLGASGWPEALFRADTFPAVLFIGIGGTLVPFGLYIWGIQHIRAERAAIAATLEPVLAALIAWAWLHQVLAPVQIAGGSLVIAAVVRLQTSRPEPIVAPEP